MATLMSNDACRSSAGDRVEPARHELVKCRPCNTSHVGEAQRIQHAKDEPGRSHRGTHPLPLASDKDMKETQPRVYILPDTAQHTIEAVESCNCSSDSVRNNISTGNGESHQDP